MLTVVNRPCAAQVFTNKEEIAIGVKQELTKSMTGFGYAIIQVRVHHSSSAATCCGVAPSRIGCMGNPGCHVWMHCSACYYSCLACKHP